MLASTRAAKVSFVGHSQGGMMPRYYIKFLGGADKVDDLVGIAPSNHGTSRAGSLGGSGAPCAACDQQAAGSDFLRKLNAGDETPGMVSYTNITTNKDEVVVPYTSGFLTGPRTTNIVVQDTCPDDQAEHLFLPMSSATIQWTLNALRRPGPANPAFTPTCAY